MASVITPLTRVPDLLALKARWPQRYACLLESRVQGPAPARYDLLLAVEGAPQMVAADAPQGAGLDWLQQVRDALHAQALAPTFAPELPFVGGWILFLAYEFGADLEPVLRLPAATDGLPRALAWRAPVALVRDHHTGQTWLVAEAQAQSLRAQVLHDLQEVYDARSATPAPASAPLHWSLHEDPPQAYLDGVHRILDYLRAGDTFQVNLSRAWRAQTDAEVDPHALYQHLRMTNPAPFAGMLSLGDVHLLSSSPERLVEVRGTQVQVRPIAGTRPRRAGSAEDLPQVPKERAEHIMLIDLERNDLGRVCVPGSIEVNELLVVESYAHVHHIVSNVRGQLRPDCDALDVIRACFPGGTITGCPKLRTMQIIADLEGTGRGAYTGALGFLDRRGRLDLNILIRSMVVQGRDAVLRAGAGIVVDSIPAAELAETRAKAEGLLRAFASEPGYP